ncbi:MAG: hypothetical protein P4L83_00540 [Nevskia sp.]|nr:hypothetical protein [Nevskia sp.]
MTAARKRVPRANTEPVTAAREAHVRLDRHGEVLERLEQLVENAARTAEHASRTVGEHIVKCEGRDEVNAGRYDAISARLKVQDRILWAIISVMGSVAAGVAAVAWDILKARLGL